jgi:hypothetical protein
MDMALDHTSGWVNHKTNLLSLIGVGDERRFCRLIVSSDDDAGQDAICGFDIFDAHNCSHFMKRGGWLMKGIKPK